MVLTYLLPTDCSEMVGRIDFCHTPLEPALKGQYKSLMAKKLRFAIVEQYILKQE